MTILLCSASDKVRQRWRGGLVGRKCRQTDSLEGLKAEFAESLPKLLLLHLSLPGLQGIRGVAALREQCPEIRLMVFSDVPNETEGLALLRLGIHGYANTHMAADLLRRAVEVVGQGEIWLGRKLMQRLITDLADDRATSAMSFGQLFHSLTPREREIAKWVSDGATNKRIARYLGVTERTVKSHLTTIFRKTGTKDRLQLALLVRSQPPFARAGGSEF